MFQNTHLVENDTTIEQHVVAGAINSDVSWPQVERINRWSTNAVRLTRWGKRTLGHIVSALPNPAPIIKRATKSPHPLPGTAVTVSIQGQPSAPYEVSAAPRTDYRGQYLLPRALDNIVAGVVSAETWFEAREHAQITLDSIGDAVVSSDVAGRVTYLNAAAVTMTGWSHQQAAGHSLHEVLCIVDASTRETVINPMTMAIRHNKIVGLTPNCVLIRRDKAEIAIEDSAAPIHDHNGKITGAVMVFHDVSIARAMSSRIAYLAKHDGLTELPNRILFDDRLTQAIVLACRRQEKLAVLFLDIDRFKHVNDSFGHAIGDRLLQMVAQRLDNCVRSTDTVSRQGGDEFVILLTELTHAHTAATTAEKILLALHSLFRIDNLDVHIGASIGIAIYPENGVEAETLVKHADIAMYHAKQNGANNYQFFTPQLNARALERISLENDLGYALERNELVLRYQPQMNMETGEIVGVEALLRWRHPLQGLIPPAQFIPIAEECGVIVRIGHWVLREACYQARAWQDAGLPPLRIAINVSAVELRAKHFVSGMRDILNETMLEPRHLELELTETSLMLDSKAIATTLHDIKAMGVQLALDDFGTGYSSLTHLKRFPIDTLKIDRSFVRDLTTNTDDASIVDAVISMGKSMRMRVVAEGVETQGQLTLLREHRCLEGQGSYFSESVPADEFAQLLRSNVVATSRRIQALQWTS